MPKSITLGPACRRCERDEDVRRLEIPVDDPLLVGVLDGAGRHRPETARVVRGWSRLFLVAVLGDGETPFDQFHHEVGPTGFGGPGVEHLGDVGVVHHGQGLPLGLEAGDDLPVSMPSLMIFRATLRGSCCSAM